MKQLSYFSVGSNLWQILPGNFRVRRIPPHTCTMSAGHRGIQVAFVDNPLDIHQLQDDDYKRLGKYQVERILCSIPHIIVTDDCGRGWHRYVKMDQERLLYNLCLGGLGNGN